MIGLTTLCSRQKGSENACNLVASEIDDEEYSDKLRQVFAGDEETAGFVPFTKAWFFAEDCTVKAKVKFDRQRMALECFCFFVPHGYDGFCEHAPLLAYDEIARDRHEKVLSTEDILGFLLDL